jgi:uncharacterized protein with FMN-binding domain
MRSKAAFIAGAGSAAIVAVGVTVGGGFLSSSSTASGTSTNSSSTSAAGITGTFNGTNVPDDAGYGEVQVDVVFENGKITDIVYVKASATKGRAAAFPILREETLTAQSANISNISGATYTTDAYIKSLQSALDAAGYKG